MLTIDEIEAMSPEELAATNRKLAKRMLFHFVVKPVLIVGAVYVATKLVEGLGEDSNESA